nr:T9SS type A sorting domain-containing protein [Flavobacteriales bacterium]
IIMYPNPATRGIVNVDIPLVFGTNVQVQIIEIGSGKIVNQLKINSGKTEISTQGLSSGVYVLQFVSEKASEVKRLIVN